MKDKSQEFADRMVKTLQKFIDKYLYDYSKSGGKYFRNDAIKDLNELIKEAQPDLIMERRKIFKAIAGLCHNDKAANEAVTRILDLFDIKQQKK